MVRAIPERLLKFSRGLRKTQTPWEAKLWKYLRAGRFLGVKFKKQFRLGIYIVDFYCAEKKLIIELDGGQHNAPIAHIYDKERELFFQKEG